ncbi:MAG: nitroreductase family protein [Anaerorhabdus sp.]
MNIIECISNRKSRRSFTTTIVSEDKINLIKNKINEINKKSGLSFELIEDASDCFDGMKSYGLFKNVRSLVVLKGKKDNRHLFENIGYYGEELVLYLTHLLLGTCWVGGTYKPSDSWLSNEEETACVIVFGEVDDKLDLKEKSFRKLVHLKQKTISQLSTYDKPEKWFIEGMRAVQLAPSALNRQPVHFTLKNNNVSAKVTSENKYSLIDLGIAKYHFEAASKIKLDVGSIVIKKVSQ